MSSHDFHYKWAPSADLSDSIVLPLLQYKEFDAANDVSIDAKNPHDQDYILPKFDSNLGDESSEGLPPGGDLDAGEHHVSNPPCIMHVPHPKLDGESSFFKYIITQTFIIYFSS